MKDAGKDLAIIRAWRSYGIPDSNATKNIANARAAGFPYVDAYFFPCRSKSAKD
jgi:hypothetical protein